MRVGLACGGSWLGAALVAAAAAGPDTSGWESRVLLSSSVTSRLSAAESAVTVEPAGGPGGGAALRMGVVVDHFGGEAKYPVGWPRIAREFREAADRDWSAWDYLRLRVRADTARAALPAAPLSLSLRAPDKARSFSRTLDEVRKGEWTEILVPVRAITDPSDVTSMTLSISDANYSHGDRVDFLIGEVSLVRPREPALLEFAPDAGAIWSDARRLPVRFRLLGVPEGGRATLRFELREGATVVGRSAFAGGRGDHRALVDLPPLRPGPYTLHALAGPREAAPAARVTVVESPWAPLPPGAEGAAP
ncbi:MAG: hypothetical protein FJ221_07685 [Lentisphaerae bacterium]|nr:hypothetical protein [Lentisphaerota bacterium]